MAPLGADDEPEALIRAVFAPDAPARSIALPIDFHVLNFGCGGDDSHQTSASFRELPDRVAGRVGCVGRRGWLSTWRDKSGPAEAGPASTA